MTLHQVGFIYGRMRLRTWVRREGHGAITRLAAATGLSYQAMSAIVHEKLTRGPELETAFAIQKATRGAVTVRDLRPRKRPEPVDAAA